MHGTNDGDQGREGHVGDPATLGIRTVSDRASKGEYTDEGGPAILKFFSEAIKSPLTVIYRCILTMLRRFRAL